MIGKISSDILQIVDKDIATRYEIVPFASDGKICKCYGISGNDYGDVLKVLKATRLLDFELTLLSQEEFNRIFLSNYRTTLSVKVGNADFLNLLISEAYQSYCSDIHFECYESRYRIRFRIDGKLIEKYILERPQYVTLVNQIKIMILDSMSEFR